jgi:hypothetical protein
MEDNSARHTLSKASRVVGQNADVVIGRAERRKSREGKILPVFGPDRTSAALDVLELLEFAWHDCYGDITPSEEIVDDMILLSDGRLDRFVEMALLALKDWRDLRIAADARRRQT